MAYPSPDIDALISKVTDQRFSDNSGMFQQIQALAVKSATQLNNVTDNGFAATAQMWLATAGQMIGDAGLAKAILGQRSTKEQPDVAPK
jgi:hypothetical protein